MTAPGWSRRARATPAFARTLWTVWRGGRGGVADRERDRGERLAAIVDWARKRSPVYAELYADLPARVDDPALLPPVGKAALMGRFDEWLTDPEITRADLEAFMIRPENLGRPYGVDGGLVCRTSGSSGVQGIVLHDREALRTYAALWIVRGYLPWLGIGGLTRATVGRRWASLLAVTEPYAGAAWSIWVNEAFGRGRRSRLLPVSLPRAELARELERIRPAILSGYPSAIHALAASDRSPSIEPDLVLASGEELGEVARREIRAAFGCPVREAYAASEFLAIAFECERRWLHVNDDFVILEPVDRDGRAVPPGTASATVRITNLVNRVQPILRYDLEDSVVVRPDPCECGSDLSAIRVEGRRQDLLRFRAADGSTVAISGNPILELVESVRGVASFQAVQVGPELLRVRLAAAAGFRTGDLWEDVRHRLEAFLADEGLPGVMVERDRHPPRGDPESGKFHAVWSETDRRTTRP